MMTLCCNDASLFEKLTDIAGNLSLSSFTRLLIVMLYSLSYTINFDLFHLIHSQINNLKKILLDHLEVEVVSNCLKLLSTISKHSQLHIHLPCIVPSSSLHRPFIAPNQ